MAQISFDTPEYSLVFTSKNGIKFYTPSDTTQYHKSREMAMMAQDQYSRCGIGPEVMQSMITKMLELANKQLNTDTLRTDLGTIANNLKFRMHNIVDEECLLRMAAYGLFINGEDPNSVNEGYTRKKLEYCAQFPDVRDFFLHMGVALTPTYEALLRGLVVEEFLTQRRQILDGLTLPSIQGG